jgi:hypothetical protein
VTLCVDSKVNAAEWERLMCAPLGRFYAVVEYAGGTSETLVLRRTSVSLVHRFSTAILLRP